MFRESAARWFDMERSVRWRGGAMTYRRQSLGMFGEDLACAELRSRGYEIVARRYRTRFGEIDIVARQGADTVFVEVKARDGDAFGGGAAAVTRWKQRRIVEMAVDYIARHGLHDRPCRFDVVVVDVSGRRPGVEVYPHAFDADY
jgi:putative endonuclease